MREGTPTQRLADRAVIGLFSAGVGKGVLGVEINDYLSGGQIVVSILSEGKRQFAEQLVAEHAPDLDVAIEVAEPSYSY